METNKFLQHLIEDPKVYYIYQRGSSIYGLNTKDSNIDYLVIIDSEYELPEEYLSYEYNSGYINDRKNIKYENSNFMFVFIQNWFKMILDNKIPAWECACLNKKFIKKEYVKLILKTDLIKLIKDLMIRKSAIINYITDSKIVWYFIKDILFTQQIIDFHKITDFKEANKYYQDIVNSDVGGRIAFINQIWNQFYEKNRGRYEYYIKSVKQDE